MALRTVFVSLLLNLQHTSAYIKPTVIDTDVAIIGGGASGTYAAVRLREDFNTSVVVIEPRAHLGGHTSTYVVPEANTTLDYGVQSYLPYGPAIDFFARFGIGHQPFAAKRLIGVNVNVENGERLDDYSPPNINDTNEAFQRWIKIVSQYETLLEPDYWNFPQPSDIPADFLVPFEEFAKTNQLEAAIPRILTISGVGYGGVRNLLTFDIIQAFGASLTQGMLQSHAHLRWKTHRSTYNSSYIYANSTTVDMLDGTFFRPEGYNGLVYERALELLRSDVLLSSTVLEAKRTSTDIELSVEQGDTRYLIKARRVLYTAPPSLRNLAAFQADEKEVAVFSTMKEDAEFVGVIHAPGIPENFSITYLPSTTVPSNQLALKDWPYSLRLDSTGPSGLNLFRVIFGANYTLTSTEFEELVKKSVQDVQATGVVAGTCEVEFMALSDHTRPLWKQSAEQLKAGFVQDLYALQGYRNMWYTGYAWCTPYSSTVWACVDRLLPKILADLDADSTA
jgi:hypothetical protein